MNDAQRRALDEDGIARLPCAIAPATAASVAARIWKHLAEHRGIREREPDSWPPARPARLQALTHGDGFPEVRSPALVAALDAALGARGWREPANWGPPLVSFPDASAWDVPAKSWHLDLPIAPDGSLAAVRAFTFLTEVRPTGGATVAVSGSHRVLAKLAQRAGRTLRSAEARAALASCDEWFATLAAGSGADRVGRFSSDGGSVLGVPVRLVELCGRPGDIVLMRAELLHASSAHVLPAARIVLAPFVYAVRALSD